MSPLWKTVFIFCKKLKSELPYDPALTILGIYLKKMKAITWKKYMHHCVHCSTIYNSQDMKSGYLCLSMDKERKKMWYIHI